MLQIINKIREGIQSSFNKVGLFTGRKTAHLRITDNGIIALSPNNELYNGDSVFLSDFPEYENILCLVFANRRVHNIAITGNNGVGKSSVIRSHEARDPMRGKGYLYISLMDFRYGRGVDGKNTENSELSNRQDLMQQEFEKYLLCQILSKIDAQTLPNSTFKLIPARWSKGNTILFVLLSLFGLCILCIVFKDIIRFPYDLVKYLYIFSGVLGVGLLSSITVSLNNSRISAKVSADFGNVKIETETKYKTVSYIDDHMFELVYALETLARDIGYTVVLEDIDRLGQNICVDIFSKLRRINQLINDRKKIGNKHIRFIYAFDDSVFELTKNTKFFDYVMSITPRLNYSTGGAYFKRLMEETYSRKDKKSRLIGRIIAEYQIEFWNLIGYVIHDYRMLNHIRNDFQLFVNVMIKRNLTPDKKWLPFVIYKNVLADDYCFAFEDKGILEVTREERNKRITSICKQKNDNYSELVITLFDYLCEIIKLGGEDFRLFTGLPLEVMLIRNTISKDNIIENLLSYRAKQNNEDVRNYLAGKSVLVIGGEGSIGDELCRQIAAYGARELIIVDTNENSTNGIFQVLSITKKNDLNLFEEFLSIQNKDSVCMLFEKYKPNIVFNTAASCTLPKNNLEEAIKNNIMGTYNIVNAAEKNGVERVVLLSTYDVSNPIDIMSTTNRFSEMIIQSRIKSSTTFFAVRFGKAISSVDSLVPLFNKQIENGGPVTLTDKRVIRYFITIQEVCQLILQLGGIAKNKQVYVLDKGKPVRILDLAESLISMSGLIPYKDIDIIEVGLSAGEKLYEGVQDVKDLISTKNPKIFELQQESISCEIVDDIIKHLTRLLEENASYDELVKYLIESISKIKKDSVDIGVCPMCGKPLSVSFIYPSDAEKETFSPFQCEHCGRNFYRHFMEE